MGNLADIELQRREPPHISNAPATMAGVYLCRRFCINPVIADLVATLTGVGPDWKAA
jgi:hypothetical protein